MAYETAFHRRQTYKGIGREINIPVGQFDYTTLLDLNWGTYDQEMTSYYDTKAIVDGKEVITRNRIPYPNSKYIMRDDTNAPLGIVGKDYVSVQNSEIFSFVKALGEFDLEMNVEKAGIMEGGRTVWCLCKMPSLSVELGNDPLESRLLIANGLIGNRNYIVIPQTQRPVCSNFLSMIVKNRKNQVGLSKGWSIRHSSNMGARMLEAKASIIQTIEAWNTTKEIVEIMAGTKAPDDFIVDLIAATFGEKKGSKKGDTLAENRNRSIYKNLQSETSKGLTTEGSIWSEFNAVTEWLDHESIIRSENKEEARFENNLFDGPSIQRKEKAFDYAYSIAAALA